MNNNIKRHRLLSILSKMYYELELVESQNIAVNFEELMTKLNCDKEKLLRISSPLFNDKEIEFYNTNNIQGLFATNKGVSSYELKKYVKLNKNILFNEIKNWVQITIPVVSLILTMLIFIFSELKLERKDQRNDELENRVHQLEKKLLDSDY